MTGHLPAEIWSYIADYLPPSALESIISTSRGLRQILLPSAAVKRHRSLKEEYGACVCGEGQPDGDLSRLAVSIFLRPELVFYIRRLTITEWSCYFRLWDWSQYKYLTPKTYQEALEAAQSGRERLEVYLRTLETQTGIFILLLWALSDLRSLHLLGWPTRAGGIGYWINSARGIGDYAIGPLSPSILPRLNKIMFGSAAEDDGWPVQTVNAFAGLPAVKRVIVNESTMT